MARAVADAVADDGHAVIQAGTGTGKSLAYLVPTVLSEKPTVIATATKALQDQLAGKDLPFVAEHLDAPFRFAVLKGRSNYLCLQRLDELEADDRLDLDLDDEAEDRRPAASTVRHPRRAPGLCRRPRPPAIEPSWSRCRTACGAWSRSGRDECPGAGRCPEG